MLSLFLFLYLLCFSFSQELQKSCNRECDSAEGITDNPTCNDKYKKSNDFTDPYCIEPLNTTVSTKSICAVIECDNNEDCEDLYGKNSLTIFKRPYCVKDCCELDDGRNITNSYCRSYPQYAQRLVECNLLSDPVCGVDGNTYELSSQKKRYIIRHYIMYKMVVHKKLYSSAEAAECDGICYTKGACNETLPPYTPGTPSLSPVVSPTGQPTEEIDVETGCYRVCAESTFFNFGTGLSCKKKNYPDSNTGECDDFDTGFGTGFCTYDECTHDDNCTSSNKPYCLIECCQDVTGVIGQEYTISRCVSNVLNCTDCEPEICPTEEPTMQPSVQPTGEPSLPSQEPTWEPTEGPVKYTTTSCYRTCDYNYNSTNDTNSSNICFADVIWFDSNDGNCTDEFVCVWDECDTDYDCNITNSSLPYCIRECCIHPLTNETYINSRCVSNETCPDCVDDLCPTMQPTTITFAPTPEPTKEPTKFPTVITSCYRPCWDTPFLTLKCNKNNYPDSNEKGTCDDFDQNTGGVGLCTYDECTTDDNCTNPDYPYCRIECCLGTVQDVIPIDNSYYNRRCVSNKTCETCEEEECPTTSPTMNPTTPTVSPTTNPTTITTAPSKYPTTNPTIPPTKYPSDSPSESPTKYPTLSPTNKNGGRGSGKGSNSNVSKGLIALYVILGLVGLGILVALGYYVVYPILQANENTHLTTRVTSEMSANEYDGLEMTTE